MFSIYFIVGLYKLLCYVILLVVFIGIRMPCSFNFLISMSGIREVDVYDRIWSTVMPSEWASVKAAYERSSLSDSEYKLPMSVMMDAATPTDINEPLTLPVDLEDDPSQNLYIYMHFAEVQKLNGSDIREFTVSLNGDDSWAGSDGEAVIPNYLKSSTLHNPSSVSGGSTNLLSFVLTRTDRSTLPPIINAMEIYRVKDFSQSSTNQNDGMFDLI